MAAAFEAAIADVQSDPRVWIGTRGQASRLLLAEYSAEATR
jgi:hypothetical protein